MKQVIFLLSTVLSVAISNPIQTDNFKFDCIPEKTFLGENSCVLQSVNLPADSSDLLDVTVQNNAIVSLSVRSSTIPRLNFTNICLALPNLRSIFIGYASVEEITEDSFSECRDLQSLSLYENKIKRLDENFLKNNENIEFLSFSGNELKNLSPEIFKSLRNLRTIELQNNRLVNLDIDSILKYLTNLEIIYLQDNDFECKRLEEIVNVLNRNKVSIFKFSYNDRRRDYTPEYFDGIKCLSMNQYNEHVLKLVNNEKELLEIHGLEEKVKNIQKYEYKLSDEIDENTKNLTIESEKALKNLKNQMEIKIEELSRNISMRIQDLEDKLEKQSDSNEENAKKLKNLQKSFDTFVNLLSKELVAIKRKHREHQIATDNKLKLLKTEMIDLFSDAVMKNDD